MAFLDLIEVEAFAIKAHAGQVRKYTDEPYIVHPRAVVGRVAQHTVAQCYDEMLAAAWLHDTVEDTDTTFGDISAAFGDVVMAYVWWLTDEPLEAGNRKVRKHLQRTRLQYAPGDVQAIKLADLADNAWSIVEHDPKFAKVFLTEALQLIDVLHYAPEHMRNETHRAFHAHLLAMQ